jgi:3',5'-cyclic AMP phosphodiesterase CpdA
VKRLAHLSDLHFGEEDPALVEGVLRDLRALAPAFVAVSGDLTQRARSREFESARRFLDALPAPHLAVPGNHDIPLFDLLRRFLSPLARYRRHIGEPDGAFWTDGELAVVGVNTARSNTWKDGRISVSQVATLRARLCGAPTDAFKVVVTHHPFVPPRRDPAPPVVGRAVLALHAAAECGVELLLAGHLHEGYSVDVREHHEGVGRSMLVIQAGTAVSHRRRGEPNAYNLITVDLPRLELQVRAWNGSAFAPALVTRYAREQDGWRREA